jgi:hypothetical protein
MCRYDCGSRLPSASLRELDGRWSGLDQRVAVSVFVLLTAASLLPVLLTPIPAMVDYVNHLARMYILTGNGGADANPYYEVKWAIYPNLAMDILIPQMARLVSVENATRLFLLFSQILIIGGAFALERVVKGRAHLAGFSALLFLYCLPFSWGFVNFEFGLGVALWGIAGYIGVAGRAWPVRFIVNAMFATALFTAHFFALGVYGATLGLYELWLAYERKFLYRDALMRLALLAIPVLVLLELMRLSAGSIGSEGSSWFFEFKPIWLFRIMNGYNLTVSAASSLVLMSLLYFAIKHRVLKFEGAGIWLAGGFAFLYIAIPSKLLGTSFSDLRMIPAAALILPAFCTLSLPSKQSAIFVLAIVTGVTLANLAVTYSVWLPYRTDYAAIIASFQKIDRGSKIIVGGSGENEDPPFSDLTRYPMFYAPTLAVHYAGALVPNLFTAVGKQPVQARSAVRRLTIPYGGPVPLAALTAIATGRLSSDAPPFIRTWPRDYDYLYVLGPRVANPLPDLLEELEASPRFVLYKIRPAR